MSATRRLHEAGQSIWLDTITRDLLDSGRLTWYRDELSLTGLTSNPSIFAAAVAESPDYGEKIRRLTDMGYSKDALLFRLLTDDLARAAELFAPVHHRTSGVDGWVSLEVSPLLAHDTTGTVTQAVELCRQAHLANLLIKIPGTPEGILAVEECVARGVPVNVTLLFSPAQYAAAAEAYLRGLERRLGEGLDLDVPSVASVFVSRWDQAVAEKAPAGLRNRLGLAVAHQAYVAYREVLDSDRWQRLANSGARAQRLLFASTGAKDPSASDVLYVTSLVAPRTITTLPEKTLLAVEDHGRVDAVLSRDGGDSRHVIDQFTAAGIDLDRLANELQEQGAVAFAASWESLLASVQAAGLPRSLRL